MFPTLRILFVIIALMGLPSFAWSSERQYRPDDPDLPDDYVTASVVVASPGGALYSLAGHVAIRMQCPYHGLDYVFSYESEDASRKILRFLRGKLKMGLAAVPLEEYLAPYMQEGRGVKEYRLNMPLPARQNLWRILDGHIAEGMELPYDYLERGCAQSTVRFLKEGLDTIPITYARFPDHFNLTRREITKRQLGQYPWTWVFMNLICNKPIDDCCTREAKIIMPADFVEVMSMAEVCGKPFLGSPTQLLEQKTTPRSARFTPLHLSLIILVLTILFALLRKKAMLYVLLALQTLIGGVSTYLVFFSSLCCTQWSWLLVPFNLLPLIFWRWKGSWAKPFGVLILGWALAMALQPHLMTDWPYVVLAVSVGISYLATSEK